MNAGSKPYTEGSSVEQPASELFEELGWQHVNAYYETFGGNGTLGRESNKEVFLVRHLRAAFQRLNPDIPQEAIEQAVTEITRDRSALHYARANREVYELIHDRVPVEIRKPDGSKDTEKLAVIDWENPQNNEFLLVSQMWIKTDLYQRRTDLLGFVNGIPLVFIELKAAHKNLEDAYNKNLRDYRDTIPQVFVPNGFIILSNGAETKFGTITAAWEHFLEWKKISSEGEQGRVSLETVVRGMCTPERLLDIAGNFTLFQEWPRIGLVKLVARNHQYLGVNNALNRLAEVRQAPPDERGRLGVFWHTQGSGKTVSMMFFSQKVLRTLAGNWTFVIVTDRDDLDDQAYKEFSAAGIVEQHMRATSSKHLRSLLKEDRRYVFTLIHKFRTEGGERHPVVSDREDVIVIADEAHRTQYDTLALNMRSALPNAGFLAFTGTPLIAGEEKTREAFGDYVSIYDYVSSTRDGATVPLYFENRIPTLQLVNPDFSDQLAEMVEQADLDEEQERKLARMLGQQYELITREDRLDTVAKDIVDHFLGRGFPGKAMVVSIDKVTAVRTLTKVQKAWAKRLAANEDKLRSRELTDEERDVLAQEMAFMRQTDMAVVISQSQNEAADMAARGLDIKPHRKRMVEEDLEGRFKDAQDPLRLAFVCSMWTTGFDVPSCSTVYLDKPLRNHSLMQTITRANRVFPGKNNGLIVAYVDVLSNLHKALAIYASSAAFGRGVLPVEEKSALVEALRDAVQELRDFCLARDVDLDQITKLRQFEWVEALKDVTDQLMLSDEETSSFLTRASTVERFFKAILPDDRANEFAAIRKAIRVVMDRIAAIEGPPNVTAVTAQIEQLLDESVAANAYLIGGEQRQTLMDLSEVDWDAVKAMFQGGRQRTATQKLRSILAVRVTDLTRLNPTRVDLYQRFQKLLDDYNAGSLNVETYFKELVEFSHRLDEEEARALSRGLSEEQQAVLDILTRPNPGLSAKEERQVKRVAEELLTILKRDKLVLDWRKEQQTRAAVRLAVEETLDRLPESYTRQVYAQKCDAVYQHIFDSYWDDGHSIYDRAA
ncbi:type I restriction endonuclease subunit R [Candidatus Nephthysia bennettiae]|uniref:Type I restriction enzyme endonuclease subunit n=1 Tax=Candidatus Nephthysia bennettiae TaxID=3127016 RepID=A0A934N915_9BACT|nr:type I restriction endonuclease subunit R [Candidatus Dormibacteraeota bacterium]MBJ7613574.1 type I restriction endonuclease subunit R [Candidatus Dormibacteraeota bacterium]